MDPQAISPSKLGSHDRGYPDEPPPILRRWSRIYALVALYLLSLIVILYLITRILAY